MPGQHELFANLPSSLCSEEKSRTPNESTHTIKSILNIAYHAITALGNLKKDENKVALLCYALIKTHNFPDIGADSKPNSLTLMYNWISLQPLAYAKNPAIVSNHFSQLVSLQ